MAKQLTIADLIYRLGLSGEDELVDKLDKALNQADKKVTKEGEAAGKKGGRATAKGFSDQFKAVFSGAAIGSFIGSALSQAFQGALTAAMRFAGESVKEFAVYEQGLLQLKLAGETNLGALSKRIHDAARATKVFAATDVSLAVGELVKAGYDAETAFALVETGALGASAQVDAATGKFGDLTNTSKQLGNILRALDLDTSQTSRVMDVMARAAQDSNLNVSDLVDIIGRVGPTAKLAGLEIEDLAAMAGVLANNGMEASLIGTGLRSVLQSLINPSGQVKGQLDALGVSLVDSNGNLRDFNEVLDGLHELTQRGGEGLQLLTQATGSFGSAAAANLGSASEEVKRFRSTLDDAEGTAQDLADTMRNSGAGAAAEYEARMRDARAELGEQLMPHLVTMHEDILPKLVGILGSVIEKWEQWEVIITGTTAAIKRQQEALAQQVLSGLGPELGQALLDVRNAQDAVSELQGRIDRLSPLEFGARARLQRELAELQGELDAAQAVYDRRLAEYRQQQLVDGFTFDGQDATPFGPLGPGQARAQAAAVEAVAESYRNLAAVEAELAEARSAWAAAGSAEEEARWAAEVRRLEEEKKAKQAAVETAKQAAASTRATARAERDEIVDEASRVQSDLQRLKLAYEQDKLTRAQYEAAVEAHVRRLDGLYDRVTSPEQSLAVLRARKSLLDELARLEKESARKLAIEPQVVVDDAEVERLQRIADARERNNQRVVKELQDQERAYYAWLEQQEEERAATQQAYLDELLGLEQAQLDKAVEMDVAARQRAAAEADRIEQEKAEARERNNQRVLNELLEQERAHTDWLAAEAQKRVDKEAEIAAARAFRASREGVQRSLSNLYAGYASQSEKYVTLTERAEGVTVRLATAQRTLGVATRDDVQKALEGQITAIERLLPIVGEGTERWYELVAALAKAKADLKALNDEIPEMKMPLLGSPEEIRRAHRETEAAIASIQAQIANGPDSVTLALLEERLAFFQALLQQLGIAVADLDAAAKAGADADALQAQAQQLAGEIMDVAKQFPLALVEGIRTGDLAGALENALGSAADFFLDQMLQAILGPITEQLTASIAQSLAAQQAQGAAGGAAGGAGALGALGPWGMVLGGLLVAANLISANQRRQQAAERRDASVRSTVSGAPSVQYNLTANVNVDAQGSWSDPAFYQRWRAETEALVVSLLGRVKK